MDPITLYHFIELYPQVKKDDISELTKKLEECVEKQEFEKAAELRDKIKSLKDGNDLILNLENEMQRAISSQDFEKAAKLRDELKKYK